MNQNPPLWVKDVLATIATVETAKMFSFVFTDEKYPVYMRKLHGVIPYIVHYSDKSPKADDCEACAAGTCIQRIEQYPNAMVVVHNRRNELS
jgi:hypothetical protein